MAFPRCLARYAGLAVSLLLLAACGGGGGSGAVSVGGSGGVVVQSQDTTARDLTYYDHTRQIIDSRCVTCHREDGQAPFPLETYAQVANHASAIAYSVETGTMPKQGFAPLTTAERQLLVDWLEDGAAKGVAPDTAVTTPYTYYADVKTILDARCANCHAPGEIAPFDLTYYAGARSLRSAIAHQVEADAMPPWPPSDDYLKLSKSRALTDTEREVLLSWATGGAPEGDSFDYTPPPVDTVKVDYNLRLQLNEPYTPRETPDEYRCLVIDWPLQETVFVDAVNFLPDIKAQVHHVFAVIADPEQVPVFEEADGADGRPGFPCWGAPSPEGSLLPPRTLTVWAPGISGGFLPEGTGVRVEPGSKIVMQMHYNTINTEPTPDQSGLELRYVPAVEREAITLFFLDTGWYPAGGMPIPANDPNVTVQHTDDLAWAMRFVGADQVGIETGDAFALHSVYMHQHVLGKSNSLELIREDDTEIMLLDIPQWDFDWQDEYFFDEEVIVQPGDRFRLTCTWDNSAANQQFINGKQIEPRYTEFGEGTTDEMCVSYFYVSRVKAEDEGRKQDIPPTVAFAQPRHRQVFRPGDYVPIELSVNAFQLQEPGSSHADHGHTADEHGGNGHADGQGAVGDDGHGEHGMHRHRSGHYHLYLNSEDDAADHLTSWDRSTFYQLPDDLPPGEHTLRVSLRSDAHEALGIEERVTIVVADPDNGARSASLIDVAEWRATPAAQDLFAWRRPATVDCPESTWYEEDGALEVQTGYCNYLSVQQPSLVDVHKGDTLRLVLWHGQLRYEEPAEATVAVAIGDTVVWQEEIEIPSVGGVYEIEVPATVNAPAGQPIQYHLQNHGYNTWTLLSLEVLGEGAQ